jgi:hypothetical protein
MALSHEQIDFLKKPYQALEISEELSAVFRTLRCDNLQCLLQYKAGELLQVEGFGYRCLKELYELLETHKCEGLLKE